MNNNKNLIDIFERITIKYPDNTAVIESGVKYSYTVLNELSNKIANCLFSNNKKKNVIGVLLPSSFSLIASMIGILKSGNTYFLIDPNMPKKRIENMLKAANCRDIITTPIYQNNIDLPFLNYYTLNDIQSFDADYNNSLYYPSNDVAYVIFTSGTTGIPKGVEIKSSSVINLAFSNKFITISDKDVISQASNISFDAITFEVWGALLNGATIAIAEKKTLLNLNILKKWIQEAEVSIMFLTTALFNKYVDLFPEIFQMVSKVLFGGEKANVSKINKVLNIPRRSHLIHVYGPTETTTFATYYEINKKLDIYPIGESINGVHTYILDNDLNIANEGELYIGGEGVAKRYINTSNSNVFMKLPNIDKSFIYKTGDWVKVNKLGFIEYIGRIDNQIKINGFRLETEELTSILNSHEKIKDACIHINDQKKIYVFFIGDLIYEKDLRAYILKYLPSFMAPHSIFKVKSFPLTNNNKVDTQKLYNELISKETNHSPDLTDLDYVLLNIFIDVLNIDKSKISLDSNFFHIGGDSLSAMLVISRVNEYMSNQITINDFIDHPTITLLKKILLNKVNYRDQFIVNQSKEIKMSSSQKSFWYLHQVLPDKSSYNESFKLKFSKDINWDLLDESIDILIKKNEILRTTFNFKNNEFIQKLQNELKKETYNISNSNSSTIKELLFMPFEIEKKPPLRFIYIKDHQNPELIIVLHHIITDGWSNNKLINQLIYIYDCLFQKKMPSLKVTQYRNFSEWHNNYIDSSSFKKELDYWIKELEDFSPRKINSTNKEGYIETAEISFVCLENSYWTHIKHSNTYSNYMIILAVYALLLKKITGLNDFVMGVPIFNRPIPSFEEMLGPCVNTLPIKISFEKVETVKQFFEDVKYKLLNLYSHQNVPLNIINQHISYDISTFQMLCINQQVDNNNYKSTSIESIEYKPYTINKAYKYDFSLYINPDLSSIFQYNTNIISERKINQLTEKMINLFESSLLNKNINNALEDLNID